MASPTVNESWPAAIRYQARGRDGRYRRVPTTTATTMPRPSVQ